MEAALAKAKAAAEAITKAIDGSFPRNSDRHVGRPGPRNNTSIGSMLMQTLELQATRSNGALSAAIFITASRCRRAHSALQRRQPVEFTRARCAVSAC